MRIREERGGEQEDVRDEREALEVIDMIRTELVEVPTIAPIDII